MNTLRWYLACGLHKASMFVLPSKFKSGLPVGTELNLLVRPDAEDAPVGTEFADLRETWRRVA